MAKTVAVFSGDFTHAEVSNADGTTETTTIGKEEKAEIREGNYEIIADNTKDSSKIEVKSETAYVKAMAVKDGATVMGGGSHVIAEVNRNRATGSVSGDNAKMAIRTENAMASFTSNCPNARCTTTVTETKSQTDVSNFKWPWSKRTSGTSDGQEALPNSEQHFQPRSNIKDNTSSSEEEKRNQKSSKDRHKSGGFLSLFSCSLL